MKDRKTELLNASVRLGVGLCGSCFAVLMLILGRLKESEGFWTFNSPFPVWFRDFVRIYYYPFLGLETCFFLALTVALFVSIAQSRVLPFFSLVIVMTNWFLYFITLWLVFHDNF